MGVKRRSSGKWQVDLRGRYVGTYGDEDTARMVFSAGERQVQLGKPVQAVIDELRGRGESSPPTLDEFADDWFTSLTVSAETRHRYRVNYNRLAPYLGAMRLDAVSPTDVRRAVGSVSKAYAPKSVSVSLAVLRAILADAVEASLIERSPATRVSNAPKVVRKREPKVLTRDEYRLLIEKVDARHKPLLTCWPLIGLRYGEIAGLLWADVHDDHLIVRRQYTRGRIREYTKSRRLRRVDLTAAAKTALETQRPLAHPKRGLVFPAQEGGYLRYDLVRDLFADLRESTGLEVKPHDLRHTYGSWLIRAGADVVYVSSALGHSTPAFTLRVYAHEIEERDTTAATKLQAWIEEE